MSKKSVIQPRISDGSGTDKVGFGRVREFPELKYRVRGGSGTCICGISKVWLGRVLNLWVSVIFWCSIKISRVEIDRVKRTRDFYNLKKL